jgi:hypothetical protein
MMPYIVTTKRPDAQPYNPAHANIWRPVSRRAVATLDAARRACLGVLDAAHLQGSPVAVYRAAVDLPESGGTVGPLPDGTVIEVERVGWPDIWLKVGDGLSNAQALAAFNARETTRA